MRCKASEAQQRTERLILHCRGLLGQALDEPARLSRFIEILCPTHHMSSWRASTSLAYKNVL